MSGAAEFYRLAADLRGANAKMLGPLRSAMDQAGEVTAQSWASIAAGTAGEHGKHYPASITAETKIGFGGITVEVGPESGRPQGGMGRGFEFGSMNQPPHLDGVKAFDATEGQVLSLAEAAITPVIP